MIVSVLASLLLTAAQPAPADDAAVDADAVTTTETEALEQAADALDDAAEAASETADAAADAADAAEEAADAAEAAAEAAEAEAEEVPQICRRRNVQDTFGKMKSIKVCRPKDED